MKSWGGGGIVFLYGRWKEEQACVCICGVDSTRGQLR